MKKTIIALLVLFVCFSVFADDNTAWSYNSSVGTGCVYHATSDFAYLTTSSEYKLASDYEKGTSVLVVFYAKDSMVFLFSDITEEKADAVFLSESLEEFSNGNFSTFKTGYVDAGVCGLNSENSKFFFNQLAYYNTSGQVCIGIHMEAGNTLFMLVNCQKLYKYSSLLK